MPALSSLLEDAPHAKILRLFHVLYRLNILESQILLPSNPILPPNPNPFLESNSHPRESNSCYLESNSHPRESNSFYLESNSASKSKSLSLAFNFFSLESDSPSEFNSF